MRKALVLFLAILTVLLFLCSCEKVCEHIAGVWIIDKEAECTESGSKHQVCKTCGETLKTETIPATGHAEVQWITDKEAKCTESGSKHQVCTACGETLKTETISETGHNIVIDSAIAATCAQEGATEGSHCSVCGAVIIEQKILPQLSHNFDNEGKCTKCGFVDKSSIAYKESQLRKRADNVVISCATTALRSQLKNPDSLVVLSQSVIEKDNYLRYYIKLDYKSQNNLGGYVTDSAYFLIRVNPKMDGTFRWSCNKTLGIKYSISNGDKTDFGWGEKPSDWSVDAIVDISEAKPVSLKLILADPNQYNGQFVKIKEELVLRSVYISNKYFSTCLSNGPRWNDYDSDRSIKVYFNQCNNYDECILVDADYQKITVYGYVKVYSNSPTPYIDAIEIVLP